MATERPTLPFCCASAARYASILPTSKVSGAAIFSAPKDVIRELTIKRTATGIFTGKLISRVSDAVERSLIDCQADQSHSLVLHCLPTTDHWLPVGVIR